MLMLCVVPCGGGFHGEHGYAGENAFSRICDPEKGSLGRAVGSDDVVTVVGKLVTRLESRKFSNNPVAFYYDAFSGGICDDPFTSSDGDGVLRLIEDGQEVHKRERSLWRCVQMRGVNHAIDSYTQTF